MEDETVQQNYHPLYEAYLRKHFTCIAQAFGVEAEPDRALEAYYTALSSSREPMEPDTLEVYRALSRQHTMIIATNGMGQVQRSRLRDFFPITARLYISEEVGQIKPSPLFFKRILDQLPCAPDACLMIGDSLSSDMMGAKNAGMAACWYDHTGQGVSRQKAADYRISNLRELLSLA